MMMEMHGIIWWPYVSFGGTDSVNGFSATLREQADGRRLLRHLCLQGRGARQA
eukprot:CAMPEP_0172213738 /NCGR_PEP_ID=MMETSP1050-20130122/37760_1 /TAXON_ID=233186 /ORGANISM="Cryptomonas curvata, Strain CCAP979/52" /LENGTH=52 /DNA_ID=CAMNT_0012894605 /DNA_START=896 /DNA_END=1050 /DNA_ORIENTATION=-